MLLYLTCMIWYLNETPKISNLHSYIHNICPKCDILLVQEFKLYRILTIELRKVI